MKSNASDEAERFSMATRLYVRLRRLGGPPIDPMRMTREDAYAREVIRILRTTVQDDETLRMAARLEGLIEDPRAGAGAPVRQTAPLPSRTAKTGAAAVEIPPELARRYVGALR